MSHGMNIYFGQNLNGQNRHQLGLQQNVQAKIAHPSFNHFSSRTHYQSPFLMGDKTSQNKDQSLQAAQSTNFNGKSHALINNSLSGLKQDVFTKTSGTQFSGQGQALSQNNSNQANTQAVYGYPGFALVDNKANTAQRASTLNFLQFG